MTTHATPVRQLLHRGLLEERARRWTVEALDPLCTALGEAACCDWRHVKSLGELEAYRERLRYVLAILERAIQKRGGTL
jgi:hypothetical protein